MREGTPGTDGGGTVARYRRAIERYSAACCDHEAVRIGESVVPTILGMAQRIRVALQTAGCYTLCITMRFEWDPEKDKINRKKHGGLGFESAALVFNDPYVIFRKDRIVEGEQRWHAIGAAEGAVLLVVHAYREENDYGEEETIRIISAREANQRERRIYIQQATG